MISRRSIMKRIGAVAVGAGSAASALPISGNLAALGVTGVSAVGPPAGMFSDQGGVAPGGAGIAHYTKVLAKLLSGGLDEELRRDARYVHSMDADIVAARALSLAAKVRLQQERNFVRRKESEKSWLQRQIESAMG